MKAPIRGVLLSLLILLLWGPLPIAGSLRVEMTGNTQTVLLNDNATISCKVPGSPHLDITIMAITWFRTSPVNEAEVKVFEFYGHYQGAFRSGAVVSLEGLKRGDASLQLPGVQPRDAGEYRCELVITPEKAQGTVYLEVVGSPAISLFPEQATAKDNDGKSILCKASGFYPKDIDITWHKWTPENPQGQEISEGITTGPAIKNADGTFNISSRLRLKHNVTYQCVVRHGSSQTSRWWNSTQPATGSAMRNGLWTPDKIAFGVLATIFLIALF